MQAFSEESFKCKMPHTRRVWGKTGPSRYALSQMLNPKT